MKKDYKRHKIELKFGLYWWAGEAFNTLNEAKKEIDIFVEKDGENDLSDDTEKQNLFEDFWQDGDNIN